MGARQGEVWGAGAFRRVYSPAMDESARQLVSVLALRPHPEGGFYRETFRSSSNDAERSASTAIYFLLQAGTFSAFHVIHGGDEIWHHYDGDAVEIHTLSSNGDYSVDVLGRDVANGERPQIVVPAGVIQAAVPCGDAFALCGCTVAPGFDFTDFEMPTRRELLESFPRYEQVIRRLTRA